MSSSTIGIRILSFTMWSLRALQLMHNLYELFGFFMSSTGAENANVLTHMTSCSSIAAHCRQSSSFWSCGYQQSRTRMGSSPHAEVRGEATLASWGQPTPTTSQLHLIHVDFLPAKTPAKKHRDPGTPHSAAQNAMAQRVFTPLLLSILNSHQRKYETHAVQPVLAYHVHTRSPYLYVLPVGRQGWRLASSKQQQPKRPKVFCLLIQGSGGQQNNNLTIALPAAFFASLLRQNCVVRLPDAATSLLPTLFHSIVPLFPSTLLGFLGQSFSQVIKSQPWIFSRCSPVRHQIPRLLVWIS